MNSNVRGKTSYKDIKITYHGGFRFASRKNITNIEDKRRIAYKARYDGERITIGDCMREGWGLRLQRSKLYMFYEGNIFVYAGKNRRTLVTVIPVAV